MNAIDELTEIGRGKFQTFLQTSMELAGASQSRYLEWFLHNTQLQFNSGRCLTDNASRESLFP